MWALGVVLALAAAIAPQSALEHVKWFEDPALDPLPVDLIVTARTGLLLAVAGLALGVLYALQRLAGDPHWPRFAGGDALRRRRRLQSAPFWLLLCHIGLVCQSLL